MKLNAVFAPAALVAALSIAGRRRLSADCRGSYSFGTRCWAVKCPCVSSNRSPQIRNPWS